MLKKMGAVALITAAQSFAIVGFGGHYLINTGSVDAAKSNVFEVDDGSASIDLDQKKADGLSGFGLKLWIDALPFVDVEATGNLQWSRYDANLVITDPSDATTTVPVAVKFDGIPVVGSETATPVFAAMNGDLTITYPFTMLPIVRPYVGGGLSYFASTPVMSKEFTEKFLKNAAPAVLAAAGNDGAVSEDDAEALGTALGEALADEGLNTGLGGHAIVGVRFKAPIIPLAIYANTKYYFGGGFDSQYNPGVVFELGGGFAI